MATGINCFNVMTAYRKPLYPLACTMHFFLVMSIEYSSGPYEAFFKNMKPFIFPCAIEGVSPTGVAKEQVFPLISVILSASSLMTLWLSEPIAWSQLKLAPADLNVPLPIVTLCG